MTVVFVVSLVQDKTACLFLFLEGDMLFNKLSHELFNRLHGHPFDIVGSKPSRILIAERSLSLAPGQ